MYDGPVELGQTIVRIHPAPGHGELRSPLLGVSGVFSSVELWEGDHPGGVLRQLGQVVIGDVVRVVPEALGEPLSVVLRHVRLECPWPALRLPLPSALPTELVPLLARAGRHAGGLALVERTFAAGHLFTFCAGPPRVLRDLEGERHVR